MVRNSWTCRAKIIDNLSKRAEAYKNYRAQQTARNGNPVAAKRLDLSEAGVPHLKIGRGTEQVRLYQIAKDTGEYVADWTRLPTLHLVCAAKARHQHYPRTMVKLNLELKKQAVCSSLTALIWIPPYQHDARHLSGMAPRCK